MRGDNAHHQVRRFLKQYPTGRLYVLMGYVSVWGLAWLQENTVGRQVTLVIGNAQPSWFQNATASDRAKALSLLRRPDVQTLNWYRTNRNRLGKSDLHAKSWIISDPKNKAAVAALVGSANLSKTGLEKNWEMMALVAKNELPRIWTQLDTLLKSGSRNKRPWNATARLIDLIESGGKTRPKPKPKPVPPRAKPARVPHKTRPRQPSKPVQKKGGCLTLAAAIGAMLATVIAMVLAAF